MCLRIGSDKVRLTVAVLYFVAPWMIANGINVDFRLPRAIPADQGFIAARLPGLVAGMAASSGGRASAG
ncbi:hypothetical protein JCM2811A_28460 [Methylorubrum rhodinum]